MYFSVRFRCLWPNRLRVWIQGPVPGFPIIDTSAFELRQDVDHCSTRCAHQEGPMRELISIELASLPYLAWWIDNKVAAVFARDQQKVRVRQDNVATFTAE